MFWVEASFEFTRFYYSLYLKLRDSPSRTLIELLKKKFSNFFNKQNIKIIIMEIVH